MMQALAKHWHLALGIVAGLWLLSRFVGSSKNAAVGGNVSAPVGTSVTYGGTNANDAAVQVAQLTAQNQLAQAQISGTLAVQQAQVALQANQDTQAANVSIAGINAGVSTHVSDNQTAAAIAQAQYGSAAQIAEAGYVSAAQIAQAQYGSAAQIAQSHDALALGINYNQTALAAYGIQASVVNTQTDALRQIALAQESSNTQVQLAYLNNQAQAIGNQSQLIADTYALERSGQLNKGGEGGVNQVAVWGSLTNPGSAAAGDAAAAATAAASSTQISGIISSIGGAVSSTISSLTGLVNPAQQVKAAAA